MQASFARVGHRAGIRRILSIFSIFSHAITHIRKRNQTQAHTTPASQSELHCTIIEAGIFGILVQRTITVDGDACAKPQNVVVPVGTAYQDILDYVGVKGELGKVVAGGAMMGPAVENLAYPTTKTTSGLILLSKAAAQVNQAYAARDVQELGKLHTDYCFNCGSCSFVCPAKRPVTQMMSLAKAFYLGEIKKGGNK